MLVFPTRPSPLYQPPVTSPVGEAGVVAHQAAGRCEIPKWIDRRYAMTCGLCDQLIAPDIEKIISDDERIGSTLDEGCKGCVQIAFGAGSQNMEL
jgi:hypothetical protein